MTIPSTLLDLASMIAAKMTAISGGALAPAPPIDGNTTNPIAQPNETMTEQRGSIDETGSFDPYALPAKASAANEGMPLMDGGRNSVTPNAFPPAAMIHRGGLTVAGGYSSAEGPNVLARIERRGIGGRDREVGLSARYSRTAAIARLSFADGDLLGSGIAFSPEVFAQRLRAPGMIRGSWGARPAETGYGFELRFGRKLGERGSATISYRLSADDYQLRGFRGQCRAENFGAALCNSLGRSTRSMVGLTLGFDKRDNPYNPTSGFRVRFGQEVAGLGGSRRYLRSRLIADGYVPLGNDWTLSLGAEGGILASDNRKGASLFERFYIGNTSLRGFDLRGAGPRVVLAGSNGMRDVDTSIGGRRYYAARAEVIAPTIGPLKHLGVQPSAFFDIGSAFGARKSHLGHGERLFGNSARPRASAGVALAFNAGPASFRVNFAKPIMRQRGDRSEFVSFSVGTSI